MKNLAQPIPASTESASTSSVGPVLIYDQDCSICTAFVRQLSRRLRPSSGLRLSPAAHWDGPGAEWTGRSAVFYDPREDAFYVEEQAIGRALMHTGPLLRGLGNIIIHQPCKLLARAVYRVIARNRHSLGCQGSCTIPQSREPTSTRPNRSAVGERAVPGAE
ncbi:Protein of uncharacterised function, DUF393 [Actinomyces bovis]|uniref:Protein of uncharacterized function, DUF393 n=1 Tax=Actinomyces bovis TaxID=1658 RepID=A0ABY1VL14_9ACTO|nr:Protein of uncharacterised function, DUF393 [Actinomyces bovis]VEG54104.1 Protein of uncharacterised function, DUF393 [Actinomyces israelii]